MRTSGASTRFVWNTLSRIPGGSQTNSCVHWKDYAKTPFFNLDPLCETVSIKIHALISFIDVLVQILFHYFTICNQIGFHISKPIFLYKNFKHGSVYKVILVEKCIT